MPLESASYITDLVSSNPPDADPAAQGAAHIRLMKSVLQNQFSGFGDNAVTAPAWALNSGTVPIGGIIMWTGSVSGPFPTGFHLCDGTTGLTRSDGGGTIDTPNLVGSFIMGAGTAGDTGLDGNIGVAEGTHGGSRTLTGPTDSQGAHVHTGGTSSAGVHSHGGVTGSDGGGTIAAPSYTSSTVSGAAPLSINLTYAYTGGGGTIAAHTHVIAADGGHTHTLSINSNGSHTHTTTISDGRPPYYALCFLMRY